MDRIIPERVAEFIHNALNKINVTWHCGEPTATKLEYFRELLAPFTVCREPGRIQHIIQTNGTLLTRSWCDLLKLHDFEVTVSIDGPDHLNRRRITSTQQTTFDRASRGIAVLKEACIPFSLLAVACPQDANEAKVLYEYACSTGCRSLGINIEETVGVNRAAIGQGNLIKAFWSELFDAWRRNPMIRVREIDYALSCVIRLGSLGEDRRCYYPLDLIPTIAYNGDVVLLGPELLHVPSTLNQGFTVGTLLHSSLSDILDKAKDVDYVQQFIQGRELCLSQCRYFSSCGGGTAANKYFEHGTMCATETVFCRNAEQALVDAVLERL